MTGSIGAVEAELATCAGRLEESAGSLSQVVILGEELLAGCHEMDLDAMAARVELLLDEVKAIQARADQARGRAAEILARARASSGGSGSSSGSRPAVVEFRPRPGNFNDYEQQENGRKTPTGRSGLMLMTSSGWPVIWPRLLDRQAKAVSAEKKLRR